jgi:hypothetical protein
MMPINSLDFKLTESVTWLAPSSYSEFDEDRGCEVEGAGNYGFVTVHFYLDEFKDEDVPDQQRGSRFTTIWGSRQEMAKLNRTEKQIEKMLERNNREVKIALDELAYFRRQRDLHPGDPSITRIIAYIEMVLRRFNEWFANNKVLFPLDNQSSSSNQRDDQQFEAERSGKGEIDDSKDRLIEIQNNKIKMMRKKIRIKNCPERTDLLSMADQCRMKNGKINYSSLGNILGRTNKTVKKWCDDYGIE